MGEQNFVGELMNLKITSRRRTNRINPGPSEEASGRSTTAPWKSWCVRVAVPVLACCNAAWASGTDARQSLIDFMAEDGVVGQYNGSKAREVLLTMDEWRAKQGLEPETEDADVATAEDDGEAYEEDEYEEEEYLDDEYEQEDEYEDEDEDEYEDVD